MKVMTAIDRCLSSLQIDSEKMTTIVCITMDLHSQLFVEKHWITENFMGSKITNITIYTQKLAKLNLFGDLNVRP